MSDPPQPSAQIAAPAPAPAPARAAPRRFRRAALRLLRSALLIYVTLCVVFHFLQDFIIFPGRSSQGQAHAVIREPTQGQYELLRLPTRGGQTIAALFGHALDDNGRPRADAASCPTIIFFYGNGMCLADTFAEFMRFRRMGLNVIIPEYVGYGMSTGKPSEQALYDTADAVYDHLLTRDDIDPKRIIAAGWSLGAAVAIDLAHRRPVVGLMTFSAFTSVREMGRQLMPWFPTGLMVKYKFDSDRKIAELTCPIFIAHGERDRIIPHVMSKRLADAARNAPRVTRIEVDSDHNDLFDLQDALEGPMREFVASIR